LAGLRAAIEVYDRAPTSGPPLEVVVLSKVHPLRSHSGAAQGGINAPIGNHPQGADDDWRRHAHDTVRGSDFLADQDAVAVLCQEAVTQVVESEHWGVPYSRTPEGLIAQRPFGGAGFPRTCYAADRTGHRLLHTLYQQAVKRGIRMLDEWQALGLVHDEERCSGVVCLHRPTGELHVFAAGSVVLATGGAGRMYARTTNSIINTGCGMALAYRAGVPLKDMEFIQFHPTTLAGSNILITEGARGEGGHLLNRLGKRFMADYSPDMMELAPRDIVSRSIQTEIDNGRGVNDDYVLLDLRHLGESLIAERLPGIREICLDFAGLDPAREAIPVQPGQHYTMGGVHCDAAGATSLAGLFVAGEAACVSVHGANRLGGNSLLETLVFGRRAGAAAAGHASGCAPPNAGAIERALAEQAERVRGWLAGRGDDTPGVVLRELQDAMTTMVGIFRAPQDMQEALAKVKELQERCARSHLSFTGSVFNLDLARALELEAQLALAEVVVAGALARTESRGAHCRTDVRQRDDAAWLCHTLAFHERELEGPRLERIPVTVTDLPPEGRRG
jgi:succinate dehydrogenase / fumarate reductase flavoprotein subunit